MDHRAVPNDVADIFCLIICALAAPFCVQMDIEFEKSIKENSMQLKRKELDVSLRMKEVDLQIQEETKRTVRETGMAHRHADSTTD